MKLSLSVSQGVARSAQIDEELYFLPVIFFFSDPESDIKIEVTCYPFSLRTQQYTVCTSYSTKIVVWSSVLKSLSGTFIA